MSGVPVLALNLHAGFACRHSGACCTAGWPIPVEAAAADAIRAHARLPGTALRAAGPLPDGAAAVLVPLPDGACPAFDRAGGNRCSVHTQLGHGGLPASCRHFPRVALVEADAVRVTLSHFCPTAAWMLFTPAPERLAIVRDAAGIADRREHEGFDARQTIPPLLRPGVAMDAGTCRVWERCVIGALDSDGLSAEAALAATAQDGRGDPRMDGRNGLARGPRREGRRRCRGRRRTAGSMEHAASRGPAAPCGGCGAGARGAATARRACRPR